MLNIRKLTVFSFLLTTTSSSLMGMPENSEPGPSSTPPSQIMKKSQPADLIKAKRAQKEREKKKLENSMKESRDLVQAEKDRKQKKAQPLVSSITPMTFTQSKEEKFKIEEQKVKIKTKGELDLEKAQMKENLKNIDKVSKSSVISEDEKKTDPLKSIRAPKKAIFSEKGEELSGGAQKILSRLFSPNSDISKNEIETLLASAGFELLPGKGSHFKVVKQGQKNHLVTIVFHKKTTTITYLNKLEEFLRKEGFYPLVR